jgi:hypothetical protein
MTSPTPRGRILRAAASPRPAAARRYGSGAGEPPLLVDPRRWGSLVGLVGGMAFIGINSSVLGPVASAIAWVAGLAAVVATLFAHYIRPVSLGPLARPRPLALATYCGCVVGEIALIAVGSRALAAVGHSELRPALIAAVVGLHFMPFAWAFRERMFLHLGGAVAVIGAAGLLAGALRVPRAADAAAVGAGLVMLTLITLHALGRFAPASLQQQA